MNANRCVARATRVTALLAALLLLAAHSGSASNEPAKKNVLVLYPHHEELIALQLFDRGLRSVFSQQKAADVKLFVEYLDLNRFPGAEYEKTISEYLERKYSGIEFNLVVTCLSSGIRFVHERIESFAKNVPVAFGAVPKKWLDRIPLKSHFTGFYAVVAPKPTIALMAQMNPDLRKIAVISGATKVDRFLADLARDQIVAHEAGLEADAYVGLPLDELLQKLSTLPEGTAALYTTIYQDGSGVSHVPWRLVSRLSQAANVPLYGILDTYIGQGVVGGHVISFEVHGKQTAELGLRLLAGEDPADIPYSEGRAAVHMVDWRQLQRWGLKENRLPPGTEVRYRVPSLWEEHRRSVIAAGGALLLLAGLVVALTATLSRSRRTTRQLGQTVTKQRALEQDLRENEARLRANQRDLRHLAGRLLNAQEEERRHLARELHDDLTQRLAVLAIEAGLLTQSSEGVTEAVQQRLQGIKDQLIALSTDVHAISRQLHPAVLDDLGLVQAIYSECDRVSRQEGVRIDCDADGVPDGIPNDIALCTYRVAQEALRNIVKHACAEQASVTLRCEQGCLVLHVSDTGVGFDPELRSDDFTLGLASMAERARLIDAEFRIDSQPGAGTTIELRAPLSVEIHG